MTPHAITPGGSLRRRLVVTVILTTAVVVAIAAGVAWFTGAELRRQGIENRLRAEAAILVPRLLARPWFAQRDGGPVPELVPQTLPDEAGLGRALVTADGRLLAHKLPQDPGADWTKRLPAADGRVHRIDHGPLSPALALVVRLDLQPLARRLSERPRGPRRDLPDGAERAERARELAAERQERLDEGRRPGDGEPGRRVLGEAGASRAPSSDGEAAAVRADPRLQALLTWLDRVEPRLVLLHPLDDLHDELRRQAWLLAGMWLLACALVTAVVWFITGRVLAPVRRMTDAIAGITPGTAEQQVAVAGLPNELQPVQARLNDLLARVDAALAREQQTTANVAHELRTPLAGLRAKLELALQKERDPAEIAALCRQGMATLALLQGLIDNLLLLTRLEAGQERPRAEAVEVQEILASTWALHQPAAQARRVTLERRLEPALSLVTDSDKLRAVFSNLISNAVAYAPENSMIQIAGHEQGDGRIRLTVTNDGATISQADAERVFEPFWRGDAARTVERGHCGLGLPLVRRLVAVLNGTVSVSVKNGRFTVLLVLPADLR